MAQVLSDHVAGWLAFKLTMRTLARWTPSGSRIVAAYSGPDRVIHVTGQDPDGAVWNGAIAPEDN